jgi:hypothetical protein
MHDDFECAIKITKDYRYLNASLVLFALILYRANNNGGLMILQRPSKYELQIVSTFFP